MSEDIKILVDDVGAFTQVAWVREGELLQYQIELKANDLRVGDIFFGQVERVVNSMNAAFINIGEPKAAFLALSHKDKSLNDIHPGQKLIVQLKRLATQSKAARISTDVTFPGRTVIFCPRGDEVSVSKRILDKGLKRRLRKLFVERLTQAREQARVGAGGFILRAKSSNDSPEQMAHDAIEEAVLLSPIWKNIEVKASQCTKPGRLESALSLVQSAVLDAQWHSRSLVYSGLGTLESRLLENSLIQAHLSKGPDASFKHVTHSGGRAVFEVNGIQNPVSRVFERIVSLPSGGTIVFDQHEGLLSIDVNTSAAINNSDSNARVNSAPEDRGDNEIALATNLEAAELIAEQLRLRDLGGLVVIDFINLETDQQRDRLLQHFKDHLDGDPMFIQMTEFSEFGLIEMQRSRAGLGVDESLFHDCPDCSGSGRAAKPIAIADSAFKALLVSANKTKSKSYTIRANSEVIVQLQVAFASELDWFKQTFDCELTLSSTAQESEPLYDIVLA